VTADDGSLGEQHLRDFQDNEKSIPTVLTTSQKLSTGVDARNVRNIALLRPVNSMIEFKQIVGRGTRLFEGKDYFTIYDFVKAHQHFLDPEWDGEPVDPVEYAAPAPGQPEPVRRVVREDRRSDELRPAKLRIKLADGKERVIQHMMVTSFWHPDGTPISAAQFMELLFGKLPEFFRSEAELRALWSSPDTRQKLLDGLAEKEFGPAQLAEMQKIIDAENSDVFDVLAHVAYALAPVARSARAARARIAIADEFGGQQREFLNFVLDHYETTGVSELRRDRLKQLLYLKYRGSMTDAVKVLGPAPEIGTMFAGFQAHLYRADRPDLPESMSA
jgi:type I restriction enzyme R subunit